MERTYRMEWEEVATSSTPRVGSLNGESVVHLRECAGSLVEAAEGCDEVETVARALRLILCATEEAVFLLDRFEADARVEVIERLGGASMNVNVGRMAARLPRPICSALGLEV